MRRYLRSPFYILFVIHDLQTALRLTTKHGRPMCSARRCPNSGPHLTNLSVSTVSMIHVRRRSLVIKYRPISPTLLFLPIKQPPSSSTNTSTASQRYEKPYRHIL